MPKVGKKHFPYTEKGKKDAKQERIKQRRQQKSMARRGRRY